MHHALGHPYLCAFLTTWTLGLALRLALASGTWADMVPAEV